MRSIGWASMVTVAGLCASTALAFGDVQPPRPPTSFVGKDGVALFNKSVVELYNGLNAGCAIEKASTYMAAIGKLEGEVARLSDAGDKAKLTAWIAEAKPWTQRFLAVPEVGTWAVAKTRIAEAKAYKPGPEADLSTDAGLDLAIAEAAKVGVVARSVFAIKEHLDRLGYCGDYFGPPLNDLSNSLQGIASKLEPAVHQVAADLKNKYFVSLFGSRNLASSTPTTWAQHTGWVSMALSATRIARTVVGMEKRLNALAAYLGSDDEQGPAAALAEAKKQLAALEPLVVTRLGEVAFAKVTVKDGKRDAPVKANYTDGKIVHGPFYLPKLEKGTFEEVDTTDHLKHAVEYASSQGFLVFKPATWTDAMPAGVDPAGMCAIRHVVVRKYSKTGPSRKKNVWIVNSDSSVGPILCKNATTATKLAME